jgi:DNA-binding response OmpR family regulator
LRPILTRKELQPIDLFRAESTEEILKRTRRHHPDVVLLALEQPDPVVQALKADAEGATAPLVLVSLDGEPRPGRADLCAPISDADRIVRALRRLLQREEASERRARVVVVEDEPDILDFTRFLLEREDFEVTCCTSGGEALLRVDDDCDLVILDVALEDADGIDVCRSLKSQPQTKAVPVLMMSAMAGEAVQHGSLSAGADGYLLKPFGVDDFLRRVRLHLRSRAASSAIG